MAIRHPRRQGHDAFLSPPLDPPLEDLASPAWLLDAKAAVVGANRAARTLERQAGRALPLRSPASRALLGEGSELRRALVEGRPMEVWAHGPGRGCCVRLVLEPLADEGGQPRGALLVALDGARAGRPRSLLHRLLATSTRELRAPMTSLATFASLAKRACSREEAQLGRHYLERLDRHLQRLEYILQEMDEMIEVTRGALRLRPVAIDLAAIVRQAVDRCAAGARDHVFEIRIPPEAAVIADPERIESVVSKLLSNAVRFTPAGGRVRVEMAIGARALTLSVIDNGSGIPDERLREVMDGPCGDQDAPRGGLGLGLYLAHEVLDGHGGKLLVRRRAGGGTRVQVHLPRVLRAASRRRRR